MSMLSNQADELREMANKLGFNGVSTGDIAKLVPMLREAADTIEGLRKQVAKCQIAELKADYDTSRHFELFGTPERAAQTMALMCECSPECSFCLLKGRAESICGNGDYDALLEWLRGEGES